MDNFLGLKFSTCVVLRKITMLNILLKITGILKQHLDQGNLVCILMDLLKAFDTIKQFNLGKTRSLRLLCKLSQTVTELLK